MVRFKARYLLVEFLTPSALTPSLTSQPGHSSHPPESESGPIQHPGGDDDEVELSIATTLPFLVPTPDVSSTQPRFGDEGGGAIFRAIKFLIQDVFGDEGWGRVASSFRVIYHSPLTTLTMIRIARQHYRLVWAAITFLKSINGIPVIPRVVAVSGTIKKLQNRAISHHRLVTAQALGIIVELGKERTYKEGVQKEEEVLLRLDDQKARAT